MTQARRDPSRYDRAWEEESQATGQAHATTRVRSSNGASPEPSLADLFSELSRETKTLVSQEVQLARIELKERAAQVGKNVASMALGGAVLYAGFLGLMFAAIFGLSEFMDTWLAALIVGVVIAAIGGFLLYRGYNELKELDMTPRRTVDTLQENAQWLKRELS